MMTYPDQRTVSTRELSWNAAGTRVSESDGRGTLVEGAMTASEVLDLSGLSGWNVRHAPLTVGMGDDPSTMDDWGVKMPEHRAVLATINGQVTPLGVVGTKHHIVQNEETTSLLDTIVDEGGAHFEAAGLLRKGKQTFVVMKMPKGIMVGGEDAHDMFLGCTNHHDGNGSLVAWTTMMRLACTNQLTSSLRGAKSKWRLRHTASIGGRVQEARQSLSLSFKWASEFEGAANAMLATPMSEREFNAVVDHIAPPSESDKAGWIARAEEKRSTLRYLFHEAPTNEFGRGTRWAAYNAFTEYADWMLPIRSKDPKARAERILADTTVDNFKQAAFDALVPA